MHYEWLKHLLENLYGSSPNDVQQKLLLMPQVFVCTCIPFVTL